MSSSSSKHSRIARTASALPPPPPGTQVVASCTIPSTAGSRMGAQWDFRIWPITSNAPEGSNRPCLISCSIKSTSNTARKACACSCCCFWRCWMLILPLWGEVETRSGRQAMIGSVGGVGRRLQTQTQPLGLPCVSKVTQVQPVSSSVNTALQYVSACSRFRLLAAARNWRPESNKKSCPDRRYKISSLCIAERREGTHEVGGYAIWLRDPTPSRYPY